MQESLTSSVEPADRALRIVDILDDRVDDTTLRWSRVNAAEQFPGVISTLTWDLWHRASERSGRMIFHAMGLLPRSELAVPANPARRFVIVRHGRQIANVRALAEVMDRMPGLSGDDFEEQILGERPPPGLRVPQRKRTLPVLTAIPRALLMAGRDVDRLAAEVQAWRSVWVAKIDAGDAATARRALADVDARLAGICARSGIAAFVQQPMFTALQNILPPERRSLMLELSGGGGLLETEFAQQIWLVANGRAERASILERFGHFGADSTDCARPSIRSNPELLDELLAGYKGAPEPDAAAAARQVRRAAVESQIATAVSGWKRPLVRWLIKSCRRLAETREKGRSAWMQALDVARAAAASVGRDLHRQGHLQSVDDAFHLTVAELCGPASSDLNLAAAYRKALHEWRESFDLPLAFTGEPELQPLAVHDAIEGRRSSGEPLKGLPASAGIARGRARVVLNPFKAGSFARGDILVCRYTDPNWTPLMALAGGVIADIGGSLSHGAVIARELGIPAIVNTGWGTIGIADGAEVEIDGAAGTIRILQEAA